LFVIVFLLLVVIPYSGYGVLLGYGVTLLVTPPQAATKIMVGMVYGGFGENCGIGLKNGGSGNFRRRLSPPDSLRE
jgi:hypothetical protein